MYEMYYVVKYDMSGRSRNDCHNIKEAMLCLLYQLVVALVDARRGDDNQATMDLDAMPWRVKNVPGAEDVDDGDRWREVLYHITI